MLLNFSATAQRCLWHRPFEKTFPSTDITHRDVAAAHVIRNRGIENASGHGVFKNVCGDDLTGAMVTLSSPVSVKQKLLNVNLRIPRYSKA